MPYRFLLEVPEQLYNQANVVVNRTPGAGITDTHKALLGEFDTPGTTMTLSAHNLDVAWTIRDWVDDVRRNMPNAGPVNYVLANGSRMAVTETDPADVVAAIRRDQPWVERSIPKIGEHNTRTGPAGTLQPAVATAEVRRLNAAPPHTPRFAPVTIVATDDPADHPMLAIDGVAMIHLPVMELFRAERAYAEVLGLKLLEHGDREKEGGYIWRGAEYYLDGDVRSVPEADFSVMQNGSLVVVLERVGRARPLSVASNVPDPVRLLVTDSSLEAIKAQVLARNWTVMHDRTEGLFGFRDPFGYTWEAHSESFEEGNVS